MRPAGSPAKAKQTGGLRPAFEGSERRMPTAEEFGRWYECPFQNGPEARAAVTLGYAFAASAMRNAVARTASVRLVQPRPKVSKVASDR